MGDVASVEIVEIGCWVHIDVVRKEPIMGEEEEEEGEKEKGG